MTTLIKILKKNATDDCNPRHDEISLKRLAREHNLFAEIECNQSLTVLQKERVIEIENEIRKILSRYDSIKVHFDYDPRGFTVKIHTKDKDYNTWGGAETGFGIGEET